MLLPETIRLHNNEAFEFHVIYFLPWKDQLVKAIEEAGGKVVGRKINPAQRVDCMTPAIDLLVGIANDDLNGFLF